MKLYTSSPVGVTIAIVVVRSRRDDLRLPQCVCFVPIRGLRRIRNREKRTQTTAIEPKNDYFFHLQDDS